MSATQSLASRAATLRELIGRLDRQGFSEVPFKRTATVGRTRRRSQEARVELVMLHASALAPDELRARLRGFLLDEALPPHSPIGPPLLDDLARRLDPRSSGDTPGGEAA